MAPAQSFQITVMRNPSGVALSDVSYIREKGRRAPVAFAKVGDIVDLNRVDLMQFARSTRVGSIADLVKSGTLVAVPQELSERKMDEYLDAFARVDASSSRALQNAAMPAHLVVLEPGMTVAAGNGSMTDSPVLSAAAATAVEPGASAGAPTETVAPAAETEKDPPAEDAAPQVPATPGGAAMADVDGAVTALQQAPVMTPDADVHAEIAAPVVAEVEVPAWKANKSLAQQEDFVMASNDVKFLADLNADANEKSGRLKNLAKKRLAVLSK